MYTKFANLTGLNKELKINCNVAAGTKYRTRFKAPIPEAIFFINSLI